MTFLKTPPAPTLPNVEAHPGVRAATDEVNRVAAKRDALRAEHADVLRERGSLSAADAQADDVANILASTFTGNKRFADLAEREVDLRQQISTLESWLKTSLGLRNARTAAAVEYLPEYLAYLLPEAEALERALVAVAKARDDMDAAMTRVEQCGAHGLPQGLGVRHLPDTEWLHQFVLPDLRAAVARMRAVKRAA